METQKSFAHKSMSVYINLSAIVKFKNSVKTNTSCLTYSKHGSPNRLNLSTVKEEFNHNSKRNSLS